MYLVANNKKQQTLVVIGGGAAGFFCAINAATLNPNLKVVIIEKSNQLLAKVKISGGGRCNTTHACFEIDELSKCYPRGERFLKKAFHWFNTNHTINWFKERGVELKTEADGRMFPTTNTSQTIIDCLLKEADKLGVEILMQTQVLSLEKKEDCWKLLLKKGDENFHYLERLCEIGFLPNEAIYNKSEIASGTNLSNDTYTLNSKFVCLATGGYPKLSQFDWLKNLGHTIEKPVPSLFTFNMPKNSITELMGISVPKVLVKILDSKLQSQGPILITHWGLSGPAILKLSAWGARFLAEKNYQFKISINWIEDYNQETIKQVLQQFRQSLSTQKIEIKNPFGLPNRLWNYFLTKCSFNEDWRWADVSAKAMQQLGQILVNQVFEINGKTTFKEEFVTCGGISLKEVDVNTLQSKLHTNLFFAGEVLDVDGITGGFNFQNAWTTGFIAAKTIAQQG